MLSESFSERFGYYRRSRYIYSTGVDFHALRTTFLNNLLSDDKSDAIRNALLDEGEKSSAQSLKMGQLLRRIETSRFDFSGTRRPFGTGQELEHRVARGLRVVE